MINKDELQKIADAAMAALDTAVEAFANKEMTYDEFHSAVNAVVVGFNGISNNEVTAYMDVEFSGAYNESESIYVYYEVTENKEAEEIIGTPARVRLSRHSHQN